MTNARKSVVLSLQKAAGQVEDYHKEPGSKIYGELVFNDDAQKVFLSKDVYKKLKATAAAGEPLDASIANQVAQDMKE